MNKNQKQSSFEEMLNILKGDYNFPAKLWVWGQVIKEWGGIITGVVIFIFILLFIIFSIRGEGSKVAYVNGSRQTVLLPMQDIVIFMAVCQRSINERQEIFNSLMETINLYVNSKLDQKDLEIKISTLSSIASKCNIARRIAIREFTRIKNPFEDPDVSKAFDKLIENRDDFFKENNKVLDSQLENEQWGKLCELCQNEIKSTNQELAQILKVEENTQAVDQREGVGLTQN